MSKRKLFSVVAAAAVLSGFSFSGVALAYCKLNIDIVTADSFVFSDNSNCSGTQYYRTGSQEVHPVKTLSWGNHGVDGNRDKISESKTFYVCRNQGIGASDSSDQLGVINLKYTVNFKSRDKERSGRNCEIVINQNDTTKKFSGSGAFYHDTEYSSSTHGSDKREKTLAYFLSTR